MVSDRVSASKVFGSHVVAKLIRSKKYRKDLTDFVDELRVSNNFRDRQMYLYIAGASFDEDQEIYKKHFAKAIGNEMTEEKVTLVKMMIAKLVKKVPDGYSKSTDKIGQVLQAQNNSEVNQFLNDENADIGRRRFLDPATITMTLKAEEEEKKEDEEETTKTIEAGTSTEESKTGADAATSTITSSMADLSPGEQEERKEIKQYEKTVQIRLCNYSMLVRA